MVYSKAAKLPSDGVAWAEREGKGRKGKKRQPGLSGWLSVQVTALLGGSEQVSSADWTKSCGVGCSKIIK